MASQPRLGRPAVHGELYSVGMQEHSMPYKSPQQKRSRESLERLLEAAEDYIRTNGFESLTISGVVNSVGLSVGAFYARFADKTSLLYAVQDRFHNRVEPAIREQMLTEAEPQPTLAAAVDAAVEVLIRNVAGERELSRAFMTLSVSDPVMRAKGEAVNRQRREAFGKIIMRHSAEVGHDDPALAIDIAYGMYAAVIRGRLVFGSEHELYYGIDSTVLYRELKEALVLYLRGGKSGPC
jgi:AcrR family transcriptional regulator